MAYYNSNDPQARLDHVQEQIHKKTDDSLDTTRRMARTIEETQQVGASTLVTLTEQGDQLDKIEQNLDEINTDVRSAERTLKDMNKCCGLCLCPCSRGTSLSSSRKQYEKTETVHTTQPQPLNSTADRGNAPPGSVGFQSGSYITRITDDAREDEMEDNMKVVASGIDNLRSMAQDMNNELSEQNSQLDRIAAKTDIQDENIRKLDREAGKFL